MRLLLVATGVLLCLAASPAIAGPTAVAEKPVIYEMFTRLFGNKKSSNIPWGTIDENGVGKFADITDDALRGIRELGTTHIWYMGVLHHGVIGDYTMYGISLDDPDIVKGRAGSPYAIKDYYNVDPDLACDPAKRLQEFEALIERTHAHGMQVIIDIVPNHVARNYDSITLPDGIENFGAKDDTTTEWSRNNNYYYVVGEEFRVPDFPETYRPLGGERHPLADGLFAESPAKWTGNGVRSAKPDFGDWYETVKINHGVRPDGSYAFDRLPDAARNWPIEKHAAFWANRDVPDSWRKFRDIAHYWLDKGVDGFRYDMAELVPVEFWSFLNSSIKTENPDAFLLAEVYKPDLYRDYLQLGRMDYLYDKVGFYDAVRAVMQGKAASDTIAESQATVLDIEERMLHFLENHDEERIASPNFAGDAAAGQPGMVVSTLISRSPTLVYMGQEVGEDARGNPDFDEPMRTSLYDYVGLPAHQRWMNGGAFDGGQLTASVRELRAFYARLLNFSATSKAMRGEYAPISSENRFLFAFARWHEQERIVVVSNFDRDNSQQAQLRISSDIIGAWQLDDGHYELQEQLFRQGETAMVVDESTGTIAISLGPLESVVALVVE